MDARLSEAGPGARRRIFRRARAGRRWQDPFPRKFRELRRAREPGRNQARARHARIQLRLDMRVERPRRDHATILRLEAASGKNKLARHELVPGMAACPSAPARVRASERSIRIGVAASRGRTSARCGIALRSVASRSIRPGRAVHGASPRGRQIRACPAPIAEPTIAPFAARQNGERTIDVSARSKTRAEPKHRRMRPDSSAAKDSPRRRCGATISSVT